MTALSYAVSIIVGYLIGSVSFALIIGKKYYRKDIRQYGSHNLGGTNAGRVLGAKAGAAVIILDIFKIAFVFTLNYFLLTRAFHLTDYAWQLYLGGLATEIGHCYPLYAQFKGGKAVSTYAGFLFSTNWFVALVAGAVFLLVLKKEKMVSLASMSAAVSGAILSFIPLFSFGMCYRLPSDWRLGLFALLSALLLIIRHKGNIERIANKNERKITWLK